MFSSYIAIIPVALATFIPAIFATIFFTVIPAKAGIQPSP